MGKYLKLFKNHSQYQTFIGGGGDTPFIKPNVSHCIEENEIHYNPWTDPRLIATFNVPGTGEATLIMDSDNISQFSEIEIDGVVQPSVVSTYTFDTVGEHTVKYTLSDPTSIGNYAFNQCENLTSVTIPNGVISIGTSAFEYCNLESVTIPDSVTSIGTSAFAYCYSLVSVTIGSGVTSIGDVAFMESGLNSITIPSSVTSIGEGAFESCENLVRATIYSNAALNGQFKNSSLEEVVLGDNITSIGESAFQNCTDLTSITIPNSVISIGDYAFNECRFNSITIPDNVTSIGESAFYGCGLLHDIIIGNGVTEIKANTFDECYGINNVTLGTGITRIGENAFKCVYTGNKLICKAIIPPTVDTGNTLDGFYGGIFVPAESVNAYKTASGWSDVANNIQAIPTT